MKTILVGIDGSEESLRAVRLASKIAAATSAKLAFVHVKVPLWPSNYYGVTPDDFLRQEKRAIDGMFAKAADLAEGVENEQRTLQGKPAEVLAEAATSPDVELVAVGSRGRGAVARVMLGNVSDRLLHISSKPVLVVH